MDTRKIVTNLIIALLIIAMPIPIVCWSEYGNCPGLRANTYDTVTKMALRGHTIKEFRNKSRTRCAKLCLDNDNCRSFNHDKANGICQLNDGLNVDFLGDMQPDEGFSFYNLTEEFSNKIFWPSGTYGLTMPVTGCPGGEGFSWVTGYRFHNTDTLNPLNQWSDPLHFKGSYWTLNMYQHFCMKTTDHANYTETDWPQGEYCVFKYGDSCPKNMASGSIYWNDDDAANSNSRSGTVPSGQYDDNTRIDYCCMISGNASQPIAMPTGSPFYLFPYTAECQQVQGMNVTQEWFEWDCDEGTTNPTGSHPRYVLDGNEQIIHYCYYESNCG